jgi:hypothetical protein
MTFIVSIMITNAEAYILIVVIRVEQINLVAALVEKAFAAR